MQLVNLNNLINKNVNNFFKIGDINLYALYRKFCNIPDHIL